LNFTKQLRTWYLRKNSSKNIAGEELGLNQIKMRAQSREGRIPIAGAPLSPEIIGFMGAYEIYENRRIGVPHCKGVEGFTTKILFQIKRIGKRQTKTELQKLPRE
jgi:hypothetical protein